MWIHVIYVLFNFGLISNGASRRRTGDGPKHLLLHFSRHFTAFDLRCIISRRLLCDFMSRMIMVCRSVLW